MNLNFELILFYATAITGIIVLLDIVFWARKRAVTEPPVDMPVVIDYSRAFFPVLLIVFLLRSFSYEPFRIPSGSLEPTLLTGDFILVNKYDYGVRLPVTHTKLTQGKTPARGDIIVFRWPANPDVVFIKRVIGLPGDHISYIDRQLIVNGQKISQELVSESLVKDESGTNWLVQEKQENLLGVKHDIYVINKKNSHNYPDIIVPAGMYFVMGDNRDNSDDSRGWGFVPDANIVGKAVRVWMSWNGAAPWVRWNRIGMAIQ